MKVLHYLFGLPPVRLGGVPVYALDLMQEQAKLGAQVMMLVPGPISADKPSGINIKRWKDWKGIPCYRIINPLYIPNAYGMKDPAQFMKKVSVSSYLRWLDEIQIDVIHVHSLLGIHLEFFLAAAEKKIPIIYTTHDFFGLCPKIDMLKDGKTCEEKGWERCAACSEQAYSFRRLRLEQSGIYRLYCKFPIVMNAVHWKGISTLRKFFKKPGENQKKPDMGVESDLNRGTYTKEYHELMLYYRKMFDLVDCYLYNSRQTMEIFQGKLKNKNGKVSPVMNQGICDRRKKRHFGEVLRLGYLGSQFSFKGYDFLLEELERFYHSGRQNFYLNTYVIEEKEQKEFVRNHQPFTRDQQETVFEEMDLLIVPSLCRETFGMVVLEALSYGVPVLVSENVGAKMLLEDHPGCGKVFSLQKDQFFDEMIEIYENREELEHMNQCILDSDLNFSYTEHVKKVLHIYDEYR